MGKYATVSCIGEEMVTTCIDVPQVTSHIECVVGFDMKGVETSFQWVQVGKEGVVAKVEGLGVIVGGLEVCL